ncbi:diguanylate cyclase/phosphodiesterase [Spirochaeta thermophila DSM 6578]|uniref:Diguanylate cyclase/phosphodiesterase n=1 Tax=Winmispira thermophila (strain ATCC 700085 / DSM 6578 / Z-1203) TaxID=869211 RepID=G0GAR7_WINT7|nr:diguanylate cyclase/phosphodiesterase [Spirochaeta thermophila DSM 6578]
MVHLVKTGPWTRFSILGVCLGISFLGYVVFILVGSSVTGAYAILVGLVPLITAYFLGVRRVPVVTALLLVGATEFVASGGWGLYLQDVSARYMGDLLLLAAGVFLEVVRSLRKEVRERSKEFLFALDTAEEGFFRYTPWRGEFVFSKRFCEHFAPELSPFVSYPARVFFENIHPMDRERVEEMFVGKHWAEGQRFSFECRVRRDSGRFLTVKVYGLVYIAENGRRHPVFIGFMEDVTQTRELEEKLDELTHRHRISGLETAPRFYERVGARIGRGTEEKLALLVASPEDLSEVTDLYGHEARDLVIKEIADRFLLVKRRGDLLFHIEDQTFVFTLEGASSSGDVALFAQRILDTFARPFFVRGTPVYLSGVVGIALHPENGGSAEVLLQHAEAALHHARRERSGFRFYSQSMLQGAATRLRRMRDLQRALREEELELYYQPLVSIEGVVVGAEALLRWRHPREGLILPSEFVPIAEDTGLIFPLGRWVISRAAEAWGRWRREGLSSLLISVNLSPQQIKDVQLVDHLRETLSRHGIPPGYLTLEITERTFLEHMGSREFFSRLEEMGIGIALDDFGTGYSTFQYIKQYPVKAIKIDKSFVQGLPARGEDVAIIQAILTLADGLGLAVIAEGVENEQQALLLRTFNCQIFQGFFYKEPLREEEFIQYVKALHRPPGQ